MFFGACYFINLVMHPLKIQLLTNVISVAGPFHTCHSGSETGCLHYCGGSYNNPQSQAAGLGSAHQVMSLKQ